MDLEALAKELAAKFGDDAAQHALMRVVERGWHLDPGENQVERFAKVCAKNFRLNQLMQTNRLDYRMPESTVPAPQLARAEAREALRTLEPILVAGTFWGPKEYAARTGVNVITVGTRLTRARRRLPKS